MLKGFVASIPNVQGGVPFAVTALPKQVVDAAVNEGVPPAGVWHTTETSVLPSYGANKAPHFTAGTDGLYQHVAFGRMGNALRAGQGSVQTNRWARIQVEIVGFSSLVPWLPASSFQCDLLASIAEFALQQLGVPKVAVFPEPLDPKKVWATQSNPHRKSDRWGEASGWFGHVDVPFNDHWDPGSLLLGELIAPGETNESVSEKLERRWFLQASWTGDDGHEETEQLTADLADGADATLRAALERHRAAGHVISVADAAMRAGSRPSMAQLSEATRSHDEEALESVAASSDWLEVPDPPPAASQVRDLERSALEQLYRYEDAAYEDSLLEMAESATPPPGMMFVHFDFDPDVDPRMGKFVNPLFVKPTLDATVDYELTCELVALHVDNLIEQMKLSAQKPLEHRLFTGVPLKGGGGHDTLEWIVTSAIDVFLQGDRAGRDKNLQAFATESTPTSVLRDQESIVVSGGRVAMAQGLWGHRKPNAFAQVFAGLTKAFSSPLVMAAGLPALLPTAAGFVNKILQDNDQQNKLQSLWQTKRLDFRVAPGAKGTFGLKPGYWAIVSTEYVRTHPDLEKHVVDLAGQSFEILDDRENPIQAPYLVARIGLDPRT